MNNNLRLNELKVLSYRIFLAYIFYFFARVLFLAYNYKFLEIDSIATFLSLSYRGIAFDTTAILYVNSLFIVLSILPFVINTTKGYQKILFYLYFSLNLLVYATNFVDFIYYKFTLARTTRTVLGVLENEDNKGSMFFRFFYTYWHVFLLFILLSWFWIYLYKKYTLKPSPVTKWISYFGISIVQFLVIITLAIGGIRGDFKHSTRPINMVDANKYVEKSSQADFVLNTPFTIFRTLFTNTFEKLKYKDISENQVVELIKPIKKYTTNNKSKPNIVLFITESYGREYWGAFNKDTNIPNYVSYTPFLDSLAQESLIFTNSYANGSKSIHGMSSVLAGIPSFKTAFTSSPYANQKIQSLVSALKEENYDTSFFHGAPNGSMGFLGFGNILGIEHYYGKTEYNNDDDFDGSWGIWDEPFFQFMNHTLSDKKEPFFSTIFTVSSHDPFVVPEKYKDKFPKGNIPMHQCVGYTDYAFKKFFEAAKKEPWFENTIFIITADHCNQKDYAYYYETINRSAIPILFYKPDGSLKGVSKDLAQQIDIYPTVLDLIGYDKPFRSWGRSLINNNNSLPFAINFISGNYYLQQGNYICEFDGEKAIGFYDINDKALNQNLISKRNAEMNDLEIYCRAFLKDYFDRIIDRNL